jgi:hypothetical protein
VTGHDISWALGDPASPYYTFDRFLWLQNTLHTTQVSDPTISWTSIRGIAADPISGAYTGTIAYTAHRSGGSGDEIDLVNGAGIAVADWRSNDAAPDDCGLRWESNANLGTPGTAFWGGFRSRLATMYFEWTGLDASSTPSSAIRTDVMNKTLIWLLGRDKPAVTVASPNGGEILTADSAPITWTESTAGGTSVASRTIEYSADGGASWTTVTTGAGPSPYSWDLTTVPNTSSARVRVRITDNGSPAFSATDGSDLTFAVQRPGGDAVGPSVVPGSIAVDPNPVDNQQPANLTATVSDAGSGGSNVAAAEWSFGESPAPAGGGTAMTGSFGTPAVAVSAALATATFPTGSRKLWVRGQDAAGNWGAARALQVTVNGTDLVAVESGAPRAYELRQNAPNPVVGNTTISFGVPAESGVELAIYDVLGRKVRRLMRGRIPAGEHHVVWDGKDESGARVSPGLYYYRLMAPGRSIERVMVTLR